MSNHFHVLLEVPPMPEGGISDQELEMSTQQAERRREEIRSRYTRRMHDLSEFMKSSLERFTKWFNRNHSRSGTRREERFKSVIVESGTARGRCEAAAAVPKGSCGASGTCGSGCEPGTKPYGPHRATGE
jgi:hypothetical protein